MIPCLFFFHFRTWNELHWWFSNYPRTYYMKHKTLIFMFQKDLANVIDRT